ncbi:MAG: hypothetical protein D6791_04620, partial [Chloroflexi bacterium]
MTAATFASDERYQQAQRLMQQGLWSDALELLRRLESDYPQEPTLPTLVHEIELKTMLEKEWSGRVQRRHFRVKTRRLLQITIAVLVIGVLAFGAVNLYRTTVKPLIDANVYTMQLERQLREGEKLLEEGQYQAAIEAFDKVLAAEPDNRTAISGKQQAEEALKVEQMYQEALAALNENAEQRAIALFDAITQVAPGYRDVETRLASLRNATSAQTAFKTAEEAFARGDYETAIAEYERLLKMNANYQQDVVTPHLVRSYVEAARALTAVRPEQPGVVAQAREYIRRARLLDPDDADALLESQLITAYLDAQDDIAAGLIDHAVNKLDSVYQVRPTYLGGLLAETLYDLYIELGDQALAGGERMLAFDFYAKAANITEVDPTKARLRMEGAGIGSPPTPTPTP